MRRLQEIRMASVLSAGPSAINTLTEPTCTPRKSKRKSDLEHGAALGGLFEIKKSNKQSNSIRLLRYFGRTQAADVLKPGTREQVQDGNFKRRLRKLYSPTIVYSDGDSTAVNVANMHRAYLHQLRKELVELSLKFAYGSSCPTEIASPISEYGKLTILPVV